MSGNWHFCFNCLTFLVRSPLERQPERRSAFSRNKCAVHPSETLSTPRTFSAPHAQIAITAGHRPAFIVGIVLLDGVKRRQRRLFLADRSPRRRIRRIPRARFWPLSPFVHISAGASAPPRSREGPSRLIRDDVLAAKMGRAARSGGHQQPP